MPSVALYLRKNKWHVRFTVVLHRDLDTVVFFGEKCQILLISFLVSAARNPEFTLF